MHFHRENRKARKEHQCELCHRQIQPGEMYLHGAGMDGGTAWTWKECRHCEQLIKYVHHFHGDETYGDIDIAEWDPSTMQQARVKVQWRRKWRRDNGDLFLVPELIREARHYGDLSRKEPVDIKTGGGS